MVVTPTSLLDAPGFGAAALLLLLWLALLPCGLLKAGCTTLPKLALVVSLGVVVLSGGRPGIFL